MTSPGNFSKPRPTAQGGASAKNGLEEFPRAPRPLTDRVRRASWLEPRVRFWWLAAAALLAIGIYFVTVQVSGWWREESIIRRKTVVPATIAAAGGTALPGKTFPPGTEATLEYVFNGKTFTVTGQLEGHDDFVLTGGTVQLHIDPDQPTRWTAREQSPSLGLQLVALGVIVPVVIAGMAAAIVRRRWVLKTWQNGEAEMFIVIDSKHTALAPRSRVVRGTSSTAHDTRMVTVIIPRRLLNPKAGDVVWLIHPPGKSSAVIPAAVFKDQ